MATRKQKGWIVPGFGLPLRWPEMKEKSFQPLLPWDNNALLASAFDASEQPTFCYTVRELTMIAWINELTDMHDWRNKIFDPDFVFMWKSAKLLASGDATKAMLDWCVDEVRYFLGDSIDHRVVPAMDGGVLKSDDCIDASLELGIRAAASALRRSATVTASSSSPVRKLVDPYLFPYVFGRTRTLRNTVRVGCLDCISRSGKGEVVKMPPEEETKQGELGKYPNDVAWSRRFQWLPFDVTWENRGNDGPKILSYINNVHPALQSSMYRNLERMIDLFIPLFDRTLVDLKAPGYHNQRIHLADIARDPVVNRDPGPFHPPEQRAYKQWLNDQGCYDDSIFVDLKREFWNIGLQMVLEMQDIDLTTDSPTYNGDDWHVQGQNNERIVATATYIYSTENLSTASSPKLSFRRRVHPEESILARDSADWSTPPFLSDVYGAKDRSPCIQTLGDVSLRQGRVIVYPNVFQTRLNGFELQDRTKPGHLRFLTLHLIDPNRRTMSTGMVPCQRKDWWALEIRTKCPKLWRLPKKVFDLIIENVEDWPLSREEGERLRSEFLTEREEFRRRHTKAMEDYQQWDFGEISDEEDGDDQDEGWDTCGSSVA